MVRRGTAVAACVVFLASCERGPSSPAPAPEVETPGGAAEPRPSEPAAIASERVPVTYPSGLVVEDIVVGTGEVCRARQTVTVHYRGTLKEGGDEFDSSYGSEPATFALDDLIDAWQEGIPGMRVGGRRRLIVPAAMGYGERGQPPDIPPNADLVFEIELLDVE